MKYCFIKHGDVVHEWEAWKSGRKGDFADSLVPNVQEFEELVGDDSMLVLSVGNEDRELIDGKYRFVTIKGLGNRGLRYWWDYVTSLRKMWQKLREYRPDVSVVLSADLRLCAAELYHRRHGKVLPALAGLPIALKPVFADMVIGKLVLRTLASPRIPVILSLGRSPGRVLAGRLRKEQAIWEYWPIFPVEDVNHREEIELKKDGRFRVVFVGRVAAEKGVFELIEMTQRLKDKIPSLHVVVIGDGPDKAEAEKRCRQAGLDNVMTFLGHRPAKSLFSYMAVGDVLVVPTRASFPETTCRACIEGVLGGLVPIGSSVGGIVDNIDDGKTGYLVPPASVDHFVDRILTLYADPKLRETMNENAEAKRAFFLHPPDTLVSCVRRFVQQYGEA